MARRSEERIQREQSFHDELFANDGGRRRSSGFYGIAETSKATFGSWVTDLEPSIAVLELGCGPESVAWDLLGRGFDVTAIDISPVAVQAAKEKAEELGYDPSCFVVGNAEHLEVDGGAFGAVIGSSILHHLDLHAALLEFRRVLQPGGSAMFYEPLGRNPAINLYRRLTPSERTEDEHPLVRADLDQFSSVFDNCQVEYFHLSSLAAFPMLKTRWFSGLHRRLEALDQHLFDRWPALGSFSWVVLIRGRLGSA